jgi:hypothetical protein
LELAQGLDGVVNDHIIVVLGNARAIIAGLNFYSITWHGATFKRGKDI